MNRNRRRGFAVLYSLAVLALAASAATADTYPIQNKTTTTAPGSLGAGQSVSIAGLHNGGVYAGGFTTTATSVDTSNGYSGSTLWLNGATVRTYCMELTGTLQQSSNLTSRIEQIPPAGGLNPTNGSTYVANSDLAAQRASYVVAAYGEGVGASAMVQAAVQLAVWNIMYVSGVTTQGDVTLGTQFRVTSANSSTITLANQYLADSWNGGSVKYGQGFVVRQNVKYDGTANNPTGQDLIYGSSTTPAVPEPSSFAIAGLGSLGFLAYHWRRRRKA